MYILPSDERINVPSPTRASLPFRERNRMYLGVRQSTPRETSCKLWIAVATDMSLEWETRTLIGKLQLKRDEVERLYLNSVFQQNPYHTISENVQDMSNQKEMRYMTSP